jgi:hypothetical protein
MPNAEHICCSVGILSPVIRFPDLIIPRILLATRSEIDPLWEDLFSAGV